MIEQSRGRILLVDDEPLIRMGMRAILHDLGYEVVGEAVNGQDAVEKVLALHPDAVIMDIKMPVLDGLQATRRLMAMHPVPIIVLTAYNERTLVEEATDAGVLAYLMKPVREGDIGPAIEVARARFADLQWLRRAFGPSDLGAGDRSGRIAEATQILRQRYQLNETEASARLRRLAQTSRRTVADIAEGIIALERSE